MYVSKSAEQVLVDLIHTLTQNIEEINAQRMQSPFVIGEIYAYTESLEIIQMWEKANYYGLDYDVENKYRIS